MMRDSGLSPIQCVFGFLVIGALAVTIYGETFDSPFLFDDLGNIKNNRFVRMEQFSLGQLRDVAFRGQSSMRPVSNATFALNYYVGRYDVFGYHVVNVAIHIANGLLVALLALVTFRFAGGTSECERQPLDDSSRAWMALFAGCLFVAHPLQVQAVTYLVQRMTSLATMFYLAALLCFLLGRMSDRRRRRGSLWALSFACWILSLGCKQIGITLPVAILLYEWLFFQRNTGQWLRRNGKYLLASGVAVSVVAFVYMYANNFSLPGYRVRDFTMGERLLTQGRVVVSYISLVFFPHPARLNLIHQFSISRSLFDPQTTWMAMTILAAIAALAFAVAKRWQMLSFAILWFFLHLALESSVIPLEMAYEHRLYLPLVGVALGVSWYLSRLAAGRAWGAVVAIVIVLALSAGTYVRNQAWTDAVALWTDVIEKNGTQDARSLNNRGRAFEELGKFDLAERDHRLAIEAEPDNHERYYSLAISYGNGGELEKAIENFGRAIELNPRFSLTYVHRGWAHHRLGDHEKALADFTKTLELDEYALIAYEYQAQVLADLNRFEEAIASIAKSIEMVPRNVVALRDRGVLYQKWGKFDEAANDYQQAMELDPNFYPAFSRLAWLRATCPDAEFRDAEEAERLAREACEMTAWQNHRSLSTLAAAVAEKGDYRAAIDWQTRAMEIAPGDQLPWIREALKVYRSRRPYRVKPGEID